MTEIDEVLKGSAKDMDKAVENSRRELAGIRTGKASTALLDTIRVEVYGQKMALNQIATVAAPEPKMLSIQAWDKTAVPAIERAILESDLGLTPSTDGTVIRLPIPPLSEERRQELVRVVHKLAEEGRVAVRHARHEGIAEVRKIEHVPEDHTKRAEKEMQKLTDDYVAQIDQLLQAKEEELLEV